MSYTALPTEDSIPLLHETSIDEGTLSPLSARAPSLSLEPDTEWTVQDVLDHIGFGAYQIRVTLITGLYVRSIHHFTIV